MFRVRGFGFRVSGFGFEASGFGFRCPEGTVSGNRFPIGNIGNPRVSNCEKTVSKFDRTVVPADRNRMPE
ncbi:MAG: hypothetical protein EA363_04025 [Balneolaceae bacterium]|nr:MAG: hypothetical protein EA363_04025 [Balneolaceae bacterium]